MSRRKKRRTKNSAPLGRRRPSEVGRPGGKSARDSLVKQEALLVQEHSGPLPAPWTLADYEKLEPGAADRIIVMAEQQQAHDHSMEKAAQTHDNSMSTRGQIFALIVALAGLGLGGYLLANDKSLLGAAATFGPFVGLVGLFIWGQWNEQRQKGRRESRPPAPPQIGDS